MKPQVQKIHVSAGGRKLKAVWQCRCAPFTLMPSWSNKTFATKREAEAAGRKEIEKNERIFSSCD